MEHHFRVEDAIKYGVEKAVILYNLRFWLTKNKANRTHIEEKEGVQYYWTYNSARAFKELFPYLSEDTIQRRLKDLETEGVIISSIFNKKKYDRTKWYSTPEFAVLDSAELRDGLRETAEPIPDINTDIKHNNNFLKKIDSLEYSEEEPIDDISYVTSDEDGNTLTPKTKGPRVSKSKQAINTQQYFVDECFHHFKVKPLVTPAGYYRVVTAMKTLKTLEQFEQLFREWFALGLPKEEAIQITRALSDIEINKYMARHPHEFQ